MHTLYLRDFPLDAESALLALAVDYSIEGYNIDGEIQWQLRWEDGSYSILIELIFGEHTVASR